MRSSALLDRFQRVDQNLVRLLETAPNGVDIGHLDSRRGLEVEVEKWQVGKHSIDLSPDLLRIGVHITAYAS